MVSSEKERKCGKNTKSQQIDLIDYQDDIKSTNGENLRLINATNSC